MDSDKCSAQVERLEIVDTGQRRRRSEDEKFQIILEGLQTPRQISATAWRYGISRSLLIRWRRAFRAERHDAAERSSGTGVAGILKQGLQSLQNSLSASYRRRQRHSGVSILRAISIRSQLTPRRK